MTEWAEDDAFIDECIAANAPPPLIPLVLGRRIICQNCGHTQHAASPCPDDTCTCPTSLHRKAAQ